MWAHGVVNKTKQVYLACKGEGMGSEKGKGRSGGRHLSTYGIRGTNEGQSKAAHAIKRCDTGTLRYRTDVHGAPVEIGPPRTPEEWHRELGWRD